MKDSLFNSQLVQPQRAYGHYNPQFLIIMYNKEILARETRNKSVEETSCTYAGLILRSLSK